MLSAKEKFNRFLLYFGSILLFVLLTLSLLSGILLLWLRGVMASGLEEAKSQYTAVSVTITDLEPVENNPLWCAVTLKPSEDCSPQMQQQIGTTAATALRWNLHIGSTVTMYYAPDHSDLRVVDFGNTDGLLPSGIILVAVSAVGIVLLLLLPKRLRKRRVPAVQLAED